MSNGVISSSHNHSIDLREAKKLTKNFRTHASPNAVIGGAIRKEALLSVLNQTDCIAIRVYFAKTDDGENELVIVGMDSSGKDMIQGELLERIWPCPPYCDELSPLRGEDQ